MRKWLSSQRGVSLIEVVLALAALGFLALLVVNIPTSIRLIGESRHQSLAREIMSKQIEDTRNTTYANLADGTQNISDSRMSSLPGSSGTILIGPCPANICTQGETAKQVTVTLSWKEGQNPVTVNLKTIIASGGLNP